MSRAHCKCLRACVSIQEFVCVCGNVCKAESEKRMKATGNMLMFAIHKQMCSQSTQMRGGKLA